MSSDQTVAKQAASVAAGAKPKVRSKWSARRTVAFVVVASLLLWAIIVALVLRLI